MGGVTCVFCSDQIGVDVAFRRVVGWERKAQAMSRRGGSDIVLREHKEEFACAACISLAQRGLNVNQESLL
jgi:hypothetical protein